MSKNCKITYWNKNYVGFTLQLTNPRRAEHRLATLGFIRARPGAYALGNTFCVFKEDYAIVKTHHDNVGRMYRLLVK